jgi:hypothetical protein
MKKRILFKLLPAIFTIAAFSTISMAQLTMTAQVRTRSEFRQGQGTLIESHQTPSLFTSQRTRLNIGYTMDHLKLFTAIQDVRVWGQDASTISNNDGNRLYLHEGWGEIIFNDTTYLKKIKNLSLKIGRQELVYDDERLLGNLNWLQQARRHDAAILKFSHKSWTADLGAAFNQQREQKNTGNLYTGVPLTVPGTDTVNVAAPAGSNFIGTMYKSMQFLYVAKEIAFTKVSFLFFKDDFQKPATSKTPPGGFMKGTNDRVTIGGNIFATILRKHKVDATFFYQGNKDKSGNTMDAYMACLSTQFAFGRKFTTGPGVDFLSGNNSRQTTTVNHRFDPLYGTPHKFWGYMDYFYVADPYGYKGNNNKSPGLLNFYWKSKYRLRDNMIASLDLHEFYTGNTVADELSPGASQNLNRRLGTEIDFVLTYNMTKQIGIELGYGLMLATQTMDQLKRTGAQTAGPAAIPGGKDVPFVNKKDIGNWAYLMITIRPDLLGQIVTKLADLTKSVDGLRKDVDTINQPKQ